MNRASTKVFDAFVAADGVPRYTSLDHVEGLASGRQVALMVRASKYADNETYVTVDIEQSVDGKNFQSKYIVYVAGVPPTPNPVISAHRLAATDGSPVVYRDVFDAAEAYPPRPNLKFSRLAVTVTDGDGGPKSAYLKISAAVRGSPQGAHEAPASTASSSARPGSISRHEEVIADFGRLADEARGLDPTRRMAYVLQNMRPGTRDHFRAVEQQLSSLHPTIRRQMLATTTQLMRHATSLPGAGRISPQSDASCCDDQMNAGSCNECTTK